MSNEIQFLLYSLPDEDGKVQVVIKDETIWCTQKAMAELFGIDKSGISRHIANIFKDEELQQDTTVAKIATVVNRGIRGEVEELVDFYNLDMIIAVGYRVSSPKATKFRQWATKILNEYIKKGFVLDDERLKQGTAVFGKDYFRELLERVRSIRASERRIWQQITDIYAECSTDYDKNSPTTHDFYAMIQNRFHYAITGRTAAEIIYSKADHTQEHMGLTTWKNAPGGRILKSDVSIAKNVKIHLTWSSLLPVSTSSWLSANIRYCLIKVAFQRYKPRQRLKVNTIFSIKPNGLILTLINRLGICWVINSRFPTNDENL